MSNIMTDAEDVRTGYFCEYMMASATNPTFYLSERRKWRIESSRSDRRQYAIRDSGIRVKKGKAGNEVHSSTFIGLAKISDANVGEYVDKDAVPKRWRGDGHGVERRFHGMRFVKIARVGFHVSWKRVA
jgi:hypothetical protein